MALIRAGMAPYENGGAMSRNAVMRTPGQHGGLDPRLVDRDAHLTAAEQAGDLREQVAG